MSLSSASACERYISAIFSRYPTRSIATPGNSSASPTVRTAAHGTSASRSNPSHSIAVLVKNSGSNSPSSSTRFAFREIFDAYRASAIQSARPSAPQNRPQIRSFVTPKLTFPDRQSNTWYGTMLACAAPAGFGSTPAISEAAVNGDIAASKLSNSDTSTYAPSPAIPRRTSAASNPCCKYNEASTSATGNEIFADEVYDKVLFDDNKHTALGSLSEDVLTITFNSLSKSYRSCGYRAGWMVVSGDKRPAKDYIEGLNMLSSMRLCANVPGQWAIQTALGGYQSIKDLVAPGGRMRRQRDLAHELITAIPGVTCVKPKAALYMFPRLDPAVYPIEDDQQFIRQLLEEERVLLVQGTGFNWHSPDHFRIVFLPHEDDLREAIGRISRFLERYRQRHGTGIRAA